MKARDTALIICDAWPCGYVRWRNWEYMLNASCMSVLNVVCSQAPIYDKNFLERCYSVTIARPQKHHVPMLVEYSELKRKCGFKLFVDYDDIMWDLQGKDTRMQHNSYEYDCFEIGRLIGQFTRDIDKWIVSTEFLAACVFSRFGNVNVEILPNFVSRTQFPRLAPDGHRKPRLVYSGSFSHFNGDDVGDFEGGWLEAIEKVKKDFELHCFGLDPWKFPKGTVVHPFTTPDKWGFALAEIRPDIIFAPLKEHPFNKCKSDLKQIEASALGAVFVGSSFNNSPYNGAFVQVGRGCSADGIAEKFLLLKDKKERARVVKEQDEWMRNEHRYMEDRVAQDAVVDTLFEDAVEKLKTD